MSGAKKDALTQHHTALEYGSENVNAQTNLGLALQSESSLDSPGAA
jgi:hypothetical protein